MDAMQICIESAATTVRAAEEMFIAWAAGEMFIAWAAGEMFIAWAAGGWAERTFRLIVVTLEAAWLRLLSLAPILQEARLALRGALAAPARLIARETWQGLTVALESWVAALSNTAVYAATSVAAAGRSALLLLLTPLHSRRLGFAFCCAIAFALAWAAANLSLSRLTDTYNARQARGLYMRKRSLKRRCPCCIGFGIEPCDLCGSTGFRVHEMKFILTDPCPKCFSRRWQWCERCGGSGSLAKPWTGWALPRIIYTLFPG
ncbi:hypothetical protein JKP88DRAFT_323451 [Tribonema minus]|uniref:Uncharacterized protein n=1 Tax=Tribonema minus TaxID=303371 RepID=A0A835Z0J5_9STRA|nr:hypothetical protein JKP88DRAFT_323451 [Tribonema minus]